MWIGFDKNPVFYRSKLNLEPFKFRLCDRYVTLRRTSFENSLNGLSPLLWDVLRSSGETEDVLMSAIFTFPVKSEKHNEIDTNAADAAGRH